jgi:hypothetical protein
VWSIARDTDNCDTLSRQSAKRRLDVARITRRNKNAIESFFGIRGEHFYIAFTESRKSPENDVNVDAVRNGSRGANPGAERVEKGCNVAGKINAYTQPAIEFEGTRGNIGLVAKLLGLLQYSRPCSGVDSGACMQRAIDSPNRYSQGLRNVLNARRFHMDPIGKLILLHPLGFFCYVAEKQRFDLSIPSKIVQKNSRSVR